MNDERLGKEIGEFYRETEVAPPDSRESAHQVRNRLPQVQQVKRRRWLPAWLQRSIDTSAPTEAPDDPTPEVTGRTRSMFSPATAITAGALIFALGGAFLIAQPLDQQAIAPGADAETISPTWVTGTIQAAPSCSGPSYEIDGDVRRERIAECGPQTWTADDPRLSGKVVRRWNTDVYTTDEGQIAVDADTAYLSNDAGAWVCTNNSLAMGSGSNAEIVGGPAYTFHCTGDGGHAGLSAVLVSEIGAGFNEEFVGLMFAGEFPPQPEPPAAE